MRELSLFSGAGGGLLGSKILGWETVGYVEFNEYCQRVIAQRIRDGWLDRAPIFGDIRTFLSDGYAAIYKGMVDVVSGGFPCQPFSVAGKRAAADDPRDMWPATLEVIRQIRPEWALLENVPGLLSAGADVHGGYFGTILRDLAEAGYDAEWTVLGADDVGAPHRRKRLWILAHATKERLEGSKPVGERFAERSRPRNSGANVPEPRCWDGKRPRREIGGEAWASWWNPEPPLGRVVNGLAHRVDRLKALGNGQVPQTMATAFLELYRRTR